MLLLLRKKLLNPPYSTNLLLRSLSTTQNPQPRKPTFMESYLINSCGFPPDKAARAATKVTHIKSPQNPDSVITKIAILKNHGLSDHQIQSLLLLGCTRIFSRTPDSIQSLLKWTMDLGLEVHSSVFVDQLRVLALARRDRFHAKMELFKKYGWSDQEFLSAFNKTPLFTCFTQKTIQVMMEFLVERAGCVPSYIADHPELIGFSLEERLVPRSRVLQLLKAKGVAVKDFDSTMRLTNKMFLQTYVYPYEGKIPKIHKIYHGKFRCDPYEDHPSKIG